jgi:hypothetical protein
LRNERAEGCISQGVPAGISRAEPKEDRWVEILAALDAPEARKAAMTGTVEDWATESILASREAY